MLEAAMNTLGSNKSLRLFVLSGRGLQQLIDLG